MPSERFVLTTPPWEVLRWAYDKRLTHALIVRLGMGHAWTQFPRDEAELAALDCAFPVILKPAVKNLTNPFTVARLGARMTGLSSSSFMPRPASWYLPM